MLDQWARHAGAVHFAALSPEQQTSVRARLEGAMRTNTYDAATGQITIDLMRTEAFDVLATYYTEVFSQGRNEYAIPCGALTNPVNARAMSAFFWWTALAATTNRPSQKVTYTNNWPHEPLVGNTPTARRAAVTVRGPGARSAPTSRLWAWRQTRGDNRGAKGANTRRIVSGRDGMRGHPSIV